MNNFKEHNSVFRLHVSRNGNERGKMKVRIIDGTETLDEEVDMQSKYGYKRVWEKNVRFELFKILDREEICFGTVTQGREYCIREVECCNLLGTLLEEPVTMGMFILRTFPTPPRFGDRSKWAENLKLALNYLLDTTMQVVHKNYRYVKASSRDLWKVYYFRISSKQLYFNVEWNSHLNAWCGYVNKPVL